MKQKNQSKNKFALVFIYFYHLICINTSGLASPNTPMVYKLF